MGEIRKVYTKLTVLDTHSGNSRPIRAIYRALLTFLNLIRSAVLSGPGVNIHLRVAWLAIRLVGTKLALKSIYRLITSPLDSFRYFEFDFFWKSITKRESLGDYLDVSSPRIFSWLVLSSGKASSALITNPDQKDLDETSHLFSASKVSRHCELRRSMVDELASVPESFDMIVCISVLEHIPSDSAPVALKTMWDLVKPGGRLLLSIPCAQEGFEEYIDFDEYGLLTKDAEGFVFGQRFYDQKMLETDIFATVGAPHRSAFFGEKVEGSFMHNRNQKLATADYPFWRESYMMATQYKYFDDVQNMPGLGVAAFEFVKR